MIISRNQSNLYSIHRLLIARFNANNLNLSSKSQTGLALSDYKSLNNSGITDGT